MSFIPEGIIAKHGVGLVPDDPIVVNCYPNCPACAQRRLVEWLESSLVMYQQGEILACGPTASAKWEEMCQRLGVKHKQ